jgi:hypothetical protein
MAAQSPKKPAALIYFSAPRIGLESYEENVPTQIISDTGEVQIGTTYGGARSQHSTAPQSDGGFYRVCRLVFIHFTTYYTSCSVKTECLYF